MHRNVKSASKNPEITGFQKRKVLFVSSRFRKKKKQFITL